jgi:hypothetical protein
MVRRRSGGKSGPDSAGVVKGVLGVIAVRDTGPGVESYESYEGAVTAVGPTPATRRSLAAINVVGGFVLINTLMSSFAPEPYRWWANFIVLPALVLVSFAVGLSKVAKETRFVLLWIGSIVLVTGLLLFAHSMGSLWPLMIVVPSLGPVALFGLRPADPSVRAFVDTVAGLAVVAVSLGVAFVLIRTEAIDLGGQRWWAWFMLAAAAVPLLNGLILLAVRRGTYWFSMAVLLVALGGYTVLAGLAEFHR